MADFEFDFSDPNVFGDIVDKGVRSVLFKSVYRLVGSKDKRPATSDLYVKLLQVWRRRVLSLSRAGWNRAQSVNAQYLRNCPPASVKYTIKANRCCQVRACPWCFGRDVLYNTFQAVEWAISGHESALKLVGIVASKTVKLSQLAGPGEALEALEHGRYNDVNALTKNPPGCITVVTVEPSGDESVLLRRSSVLLVPVKLAVPEAFAQAVIYRPESNDRKGRVKMLTKVLHYPVGMLRGNSKIAADILNAVTRNSRVFRAAGVLKNKSQWQATFHNLQARADTE